MKYSFALAALAGAVFASAAPKATTASTSTTKDQFSVRDLTSGYKGKDRKIQFTFVDWSTTPEQATHCSLQWSGEHPPRAPIKCAEPWFTAGLRYYDDSKNFALNLDHAYGENCKSCGDPDDEDYNGDVGSCMIMVDDNHFNEEGSWTSKDKTASFFKASAAIKCPVDFDN